MTLFDDIRALLSGLNHEAGQRLPAPVVSLLLFLGVILLALALHRLALAAGRRPLPFEKLTVTAVPNRVRGLSRLAAGLVAAVIVLPLPNLSEPLLGYL